MSQFDVLLDEIQACTRCAGSMPHEPRPVLQAHPDARIVIISQAPGWRVHASGIPFDDPSGDRLRTWLGISRDDFYDQERIAIIPMSFCYPGTGRSGDLPPRTECAPAWHDALFAHLPRLELRVLVGRYAQAHYLDERGSRLTDWVRDWKKHWPGTILLPHPSPRNNRWLVRNPWFEKELVPALQSRVGEILGDPAHTRTNEHAQHSQLITAGASSLENHDA